MTAIPHTLKTTSGEAMEDARRYLMVGWLRDVMRTSDSRLVQSLCRDMILQIKGISTDMDQLWLLLEQAMVICEEEDFFLLKKVEDVLCN